MTHTILSMPDSTTQPVALTRSVRFCINDGETSTDQPRVNSYAAWPAMTGLGRFYQIDVLVRGTPDPITGYLMNITEIDQAVRSAAIPVIQQTVAEAPTSDPVAMLPRLFHVIGEALPQNERADLEFVRWQLTPFYSVEMTREDMTKMTSSDAQRATAVIRSNFSFAASHRLHCPELSDDENRETFGKCNNPHGHGHNYRLEVAVNVSTDHAGRIPSMSRSSIVSITNT